MIELLLLLLVIFVFLNNYTYYSLARKGTGKEFLLVCAQPPHPAGCLDPTAAALIYLPANSRQGFGSCFHVSCLSAFLLLDFLTIDIVTKAIWTLDVALICNRRLKLDSYFLAYTKTNLKWTNGLNVRPKALKPLKGNTLSHRQSQGLKRGVAGEFSLWIRISSSSPTAHL